jgi:hypothetical protein
MLGFRFHGRDRGMRQLREVPAKHAAISFPAFAGRERTSESKSPRPNLVIDHNVLDALLDRLVLWGAL